MKNLKIVFRLLAIYLIFLVAECNCLNVNVANLTKQAISICYWGEQKDTNPWVIESGETIRKTVADKEKFTLYFYFGSEQSKFKDKETCFVERVTGDTVNKTFPSGSHDKNVVVYVNPEDNQHHIDTWEN